MKNVLINFCFIFSLSFFLYISYLFDRVFFFVVISLVCLTSFIFVFNIIKRRQKYNKLKSDLDRFNLNYIKNNIISNAIKKDLQ